MLILIGSFQLPLRNVFVFNTNRFQKN